MLPQIVQIVTPIALSGRMVASKGQRATAEVPCTRHVLWRRCYGRRVAWAIIFVFVCFVLFVVSPLPPCLPFYFRPTSRSHNALCVHLMYECVCGGVLQGWQLIIGRSCGRGSRKALVRLEEDDCGEGAETEKEKREDEQKKRGEMRR